MIIKTGSKASFMGNLLKQCARILPRRMLASDFSLSQWTINLIELGWFIRKFKPNLMRHGLKTKRLNIEGVNCEWLYKREEDKKKVVFYLHGGAYLYGDLAKARHRSMRYARFTKASVFVVDYRVSAAGPFPAALNDAFTAYVYLKNLDPETEIILVGDSAGGGLALSLTHRLKALGLPLPSRLLLNSPWTDLSCGSKSCWCKQPLDTVLYVPLLRQCADLYAGPENLKNPLLSPLFGDFTGFPETYIQVGTDEILLSDSTRLARRMEKAGVRVRLHIWEGMFHMFHYWEWLCRESYMVCKENYGIIENKIRK